MSAPRDSENDGIRVESTTFSPPEDLSSEWTLQGCAEIEHQGELRPSLGRIALLSRIGRGGMGVVYYGVNPRLGTEVAVKILPRDLEDRSRDFVERFVREARLAARLRSPHLVGVLDVDRDEESGVHFLVMEYVRGLSAADWLVQIKQQGRVGAPERAALDLCIAATRGLEAAHVEGIVHRDIKPANVLIPVDVQGRPELERAKLADLGLARREESGQSITGSEIAMGTPGYMAPEQARDVKRAKKPADVFGIGATLYALLSGRAPFAAENGVQAILATIEGKWPPLEELRPDVSHATALLVKRCLAPEPTERYPDASALVEALGVCRDALDRDVAETIEVSSVLETLVRREERGKRVATELSAPELGAASRSAGTPPTAAASRATTPVATVPMQPAARRPRTAVWVAGAAALLVAGWLGAHRFGGDGRNDGRGDRGSGHRGGGGGSAPVPVPVAPQQVAFGRLEPALGAVLPSSDVSIRGRVDGALPDGALVWADAVSATPDANGDFAISLTFGEGPHEVRVEVRAGTRTLHREERAIVVDVTPPELAVEAPEVTYTSAAELAVEGAVRDATSTSVRVAGVAASVVNGRFAATVPLAPGRAELALVARDAAGLETRSSLVVHRDSVAPELELTAPADGLVQQTSTVAVRGVVRDELTTRVFVGGVPHEPGADGAFDIEHLLEPGDGERALEVVAEDRAGNRSAPRFVRVTVDSTPPVVTVDDPRPGAQGGVVVTGRVDEDGCTVTVDGEPVALAGRGFELQYALAPGEARTLDVVATDAAKNERQLSVDVVAPVPVGSITAFNDRWNLVVVTCEAGVEPPKKGERLYVVRNDAIVGYLEVTLVGEGGKVSCNPVQPATLADFKRLGRVLRGR